ncbi:hypothetical protein HQ544_01705 [Candidatus Falkowbacteria bacterium]|nr:hypothetical protein [Candidatus Falkowbacteria bacterium]
MIERYQDEAIAEIWSDSHKLNLWQQTELAVVRARANLGRVPDEVNKEFARILATNPIDLGWWLQRDQEIRHDLNAFLEERSRFLPPRLQVHLHEKMTSYDTEEPAFAKMLRESSVLVKSHYNELEVILQDMASRYRYTIMNGRTHGQEAELQTFGKRCLTWLRDIRASADNLQRSEDGLRYSKLSGAIGNYGSMDPVIEKEALGILGFEPYYGATQIIPRELYAPIAQALCQLVLTLDKIATAIRLGARSGRPIYQEPFGKKQKGSSAMPNKKNTISTEQVEGMARMARAYLMMIMENIKTWEERAIEQSCVERVAWPDLFCVVVHSLRTMGRVLKGLVVYPDNMLLEIIECRGCYASGEAKEVIKELGLPLSLTAEEAYRIVQLAAFNAFEPDKEAKSVRTSIPSHLTEADELLSGFRLVPRPTPVSIQEIIAEARLKTSTQLEATKGDVQRWNRILEQIFQEQGNRDRWNRIFLPSFLLRNEAKLYCEILD